MQLLIRTMLTTEWDQLTWPVIKHDDCGAKPRAPATVILTASPAQMIEFATTPDPIFLAILREALDHVRNDLYPFLPTAQPTEQELADLNETYSRLYPELTPFFGRADVLAVVECLRSAVDDDTLYRLTDFHWLVLYVCLDMFCDLHNDGVLGTDGQVGSYTIDRIDLNGIVERFFFDTDFAFGPEFLVARERSIFPVPDVSPQAVKIAAGVRPDEADLSLTPIAPSDPWAGKNEQSQLPASGYIGPYPMREPPTDAAE